MKICKKCNVMKLLDNFRKLKASNDGYSYYCKNCISKYDKKYCEENKDKIRECREKNKDKKKEYYKKNKEHINKVKRAYSKTDKGRRAKKKYNAKNPKKIKVHNIVHSAIKNGEIKIQPCEVCNSTERIEAHHTDYSKPLDIMWLCKSCHAEWHAEHGRALNG